jgi:hypothetical protein
MSNNNNSALRVKQTQISMRTQQQEDEQMKRSSLSTNSQYTNINKDTFISAPQANPVQTPTKSFNLFNGPLKQNTQSNIEGSTSSSNSLGPANNMFTLKNIISKQKRAELNLN